MIRLMYDGVLHLPAGEKGFVTPSSSSGFTSSKKPKPLHSTMDEKFVGGTMSTPFLDCGDDSNSTDFEVPQYPIEEKQNRQHMEREMSVK